MKTYAHFTQRGTYSNGRTGRKTIARSPEVWQHCIAEHRRAMHDGKHDPACAACIELTTRAKADGCEVEL